MAEGEEELSGEGRGRDATPGKETMARYQGAGYENRDQDYHDETQLCLDFTH